MGKSTISTGPFWSLQSVLVYQRVQSAIHTFCHRCHQKLALDSHPSISQHISATWIRTEHQRNHGKNEKYWESRTNGKHWKTWKDPQLSQLQSIMKVKREGSTHKVCNHPGNAGLIPQTIDRTYQALRLIQSQESQDRRSLRSLSG